MGQAAGNTEQDATGQNVETAGGDTLGNMDDDQQVQQEQEMGGYDDTQQQNVVAIKHYNVKQLPCTIYFDLDRPCFYALTSLNIFICIALCSVTTKFIHFIN